MGLVIQIIQFAVRLIILLVFIKVIVSYFLSPYHPVREFLDRLVEPLLRPIRRILPAMGPLDFSPFVLIILVQIAGSLLISLLRSL